MQTFALLALATCAIAVPSPEHISIDISVDSNSGHGVSQNHISTAKMPFGTNGGYCIPFYGHQCSAGEENYSCCEPFSCVDDRSGQSVKRCLPKEDNDREIKSKKSSSSISKTKNDNDDVCLPPWEDGHMICGIGSPRYKCCADQVFSCQEFGKSGMYGCQPRLDEDTSSVATKDVEEEDNDDDDDFCLPPWYIAHMFCGIGEKRFKCCDREMECKKLGGPGSTGYGCLHKDDNRDAKKLSLGERILRAEML